MSHAPATLATPDPKLVETAVKTVQMLAVDMVEKANSGHPGAPLGLAAIAFELWSRELSFDPRDPQWPGRDRFVLSCGHASALLYSLLFEYTQPWAAHLPGVLQRPLGSERYPTWLGLLFLLVVLASPGGLMGLWHSGLEWVERRFAPRGGGAAQVGESA